MVKFISLYRATGPGLDQQRVCFSVEHERILWHSISMEGVLCGC